MKLYAEITKSEKQEDGTIKVYGYASSASIDSDGETITPEAMKAAIPEYMKFGAVREMHGKSAAGTAIEARVEDDGRTFFGAHIVDPVAVKKCTTGVYKGFSIGGSVTQRDDLNKSIIKGLNLVEISLVDRPANPDAVFTCFKADDPEKAKKEDEGAEEGKEKPDDDAESKGKESSKDEDKKADKDKAEEGKSKSEKDEEAEKSAVVKMQKDLDELQKAQKENAESLQKAMAERDEALAKMQTMQARIDELEKQAAPAKAVLKPAAIVKAEDNGGGDQFAGFTGITKHDGTLDEVATLVKAAQSGFIK